MSDPLCGRSREAVFLGYHSITEGGPPFLSLSSRTFGLHLDILVRKGFHGGTRADLQRLASGTRLEGRRAFLTFDDGFADTLTAALPPMVERGLRGMAFVLPGHLASGAPLAWPEVRGATARSPEVMRSMDWPMVEELVEAGWEIGSHTMSHPRLPELSDEELRQELLDSRRLIASRLGRCELLAYPFGAWDERVAAAAADAGYSFAFSLPLRQQMRATRLSIPRVTIDHRDSPAIFRAKLSPAGRLALFSPLRPMVRKLRGNRPHSHAE